MSKEVKEFIPTNHNPLPWSVMENNGRAGIWIGVKAANGKRVCNCRNKKDAELIVKAVNSTDR